jgi:hypothetical protein
LRSGAAATATHSRISRWAAASAIGAARSKNSSSRAPSGNSHGRSEPQESDCATQMKTESLGLFMDRMNLCLALIRVGESQRAQEQLRLMRVIADGEPLLLDVWRSLIPMCPPVVEP